MVTTTLAQKVHTSGWNTSSILSQRLSSYIGSYVNSLPTELNQWNDRIQLFRYYSQKYINNFSCSSPVANTLLSYAKFRKCILILKFMQYILILWRSSVSFVSLSISSFRLLFSVTNFWHCSLACSSSASLFSISSWI